MSDIPSILNSNSYADYLNKLNTKISTIQSELKTGQNTLTKTQQAQVVSLSTKSMQYASAEQSVADAKSTISLAQAGLTSIASVMGQMQILAMEASDPNLSGDNAYFLDRSYQSLIGQVVTQALGATSNGNNLLSGTAGLQVQTGVSSNPSTMITVNNVNIYGLMTMGAMSGSSIDTPSHAQDVMIALNQAMMKVQGGQDQLTASAKQLDFSNMNLVNLNAQAQQSINSIQHVKVSQLSAQLKLLQQLQGSYSTLVSQMNSSASINLNILT